MPSEKKALNIDPFDPVAGRFSLGGVEHEVRHLTGRDYRVLAGKYTALEAYALVARIVPTLTADDVDGLTGVQVGAIIAVADGRVADVESQFPNDTGPVPMSTSAQSGAVDPA